MNWILLNEEKYFNGNIKSRTSAMKIVDHAACLIREESYKYNGEIAATSIIKVSWIRIVFDEENNVYKLVHVNNKDYDKEPDEE